MQKKFLWFVLLILALGACRNPFAVLLQKKETSRSAKENAVIDAATHAQALKGNILVASDGQSQITLPAGWVPISDLNEKAELQAGNRVSIMYMVVLTESRSDFEKMDIQKHSDTTRDSLKSALTGFNEQDR